MDKTVAYRILSQALEQYRHMDFTELSAKVGKTFSSEILDPSNILYSVEMKFSWSNPARQELIVSGRIDDQNTFRFSSLEEKIHIRNPSL